MEFSITTLSSYYYVNKIIEIKQLLRHIAICNDALVLYCVTPALFSFKMVHSCMSLV